MDYYIIVPREHRNLKEFKQTTSNFHILPLFIYCRIGSTFRRCGANKKTTFRSFYMPASGSIRKYMPAANNDPIFWFKYIPPIITPFHENRPKSPPSSVCFLILFSSVCPLRLQCRSSIQPLSADFFLSHYQNRAY